MAALDNINQRQNALRLADSQLAWLKHAFWSWFAANQYDEVLTFKVWVFKKTVTLKDLRPVFERFFGPYQPVV